MQKNTDLFKNRAIMAPMSGVNTPAFCRMLEHLGCGIAYTGLLTSNGIVHQSAKTMSYVNSLPDGIEIVAQIFGSVPEIMARSAAILESTGRFAAIDINMGCPAPKVIKTKSGSAMMRDPELVKRTVGSVVNAVDIPVTVKMRSGMSNSELNYLEIAVICESEGAAAIALHPRPQTQGFSGSADWNHVAKLKKSLRIPVIGSGDIDTPVTALDRMKETGCDSIMIGRAARGNPGLPGRTQKLIDGEDPGQPPSHSDRIRLSILHFKHHIEIEPGVRGVHSMRGQLSWYLKSIPNASPVRALINRCNDHRSVIEILLSFANDLENIHNDDTGEHRH